MKRKCVIVVAIVLMIAMAAPGIGSGQSSRCVILEKQGNMALVRCDGKPARYIDLRGRADMYNTGDTIDEPSGTTLPKSPRPGVRQK